MIRFDSNSGYSVAFANKTRKLKPKTKNLAKEEQEPIVFFPSVAAGDFIYFHKESLEYSTKSESESNYDWDEVYDNDDDGEDVDDVINEMVVGFEEEELDGLIDGINNTLNGMIQNLDEFESEDDEEKEGMTEADMNLMESQLERDLDREESDESDEEVQISRDDFMQAHKNAVIKGVNLAVREMSTNIPKTILEKTPDGVYDRAQMVKLSYDISGAKNNSDLDSAESEFIDAVQSKSLIFMRNYSNRDAAVIYDNAERVYHIAFHGANAEGGNSTEDWKSIKSVMGTRFDKDPQYLRSEKDLELFLGHIAEVDPGASVELTGYSLGGAKSLHLAEKFNLEGMHLNAFTSPLSKYEVSDVFLRAKQQMIRVVNDPYTAQSSLNPVRHASSNREHTTMLPLKNNTNFDDAHSLDQFTANKPRGADSLVEKSNVVGRGLGKAAIIGGGVYGGYEGYRQGRENSGTLSEEVYRGVLGSAESTLPIVTGGDIVESGIVGFTQGEISNSFRWVSDSIFGKPQEPELPTGYVQVSGQGFTPP